MTGTWSSCHFHVGGCLKEPKMERLLFKNTKSLGVFPVSWNAIWSYRARMSPRPAPTAGDITRVRPHQCHQYRLCPGHCILCHFPSHMATAPESNLAQERLVGRT